MSTDDNKPDTVLRVLRAVDDNISLLMHRVREQYPDAVTGIVIVFDKDGGMHTNYRANNQELALASVRLAALANQGDD